MGSSTELVECLGLDMKANALTLRLNVNVGNLKKIITISNIRENGFIMGVKYV